MPARSDDPLRRVTLNLYEADCIAMERWHGQGWTTRIREIIHNRVEDTNRIGTTVMPRPRTLGDLSDD